MERDEVRRGLDALRRAVLEVLVQPAVPVQAGPLLSQAGSGPGRSWGGTGRGTTSGTAAEQDPDEHDPDDHDQAASSAEDEAEQQRLIALVELARGGDTEAFGQLYDHYHPGVFRFLYYRVGSVQLAEDLTSDTFFRALRAMSTFRWQGKDFGAWLTTIARNLTTDHYKAGRTRLEQTTEDMSTLDRTTEGPEQAVLTSLTHEALLEALRELPAEQRDCLVMRFLQGLSIAETAEVLGRSAGAVKQLQLRGVRNLAKALPEDLR